MKYLSFIVCWLAGVFAALCPIPLPAKAGSSVPPTNSATLFFENTWMAIQRACARGLLEVHLVLHRLGFVPSLTRAFDDEDDINTKMLGHLDNLSGTLTKYKSQQDQLAKNYDSLQRETKQAFEELTHVKNHLGSLKEFEIAMRKTQLQMRREQRLAFGDPIARIAGDEEMRTRLNGLVRMALGSRDPHIGEIGQEMLKRVDRTTTRALVTGSTPGSTLMTTDLANEIYDVLGTYGIWNTFSVQRVGTTTTKFPVTTARPVALAVRKLANRKMVEDTTLAGTSVDGTVELWGVMLGVEIELLQDAEYDVTRYLLENFGQAMAYRFDHLCLTADGTADEYDSGMSGIFVTGTAADCAAGNTTIETTDLEDWIKCITTPAASVLQRPARWWMHPTCLARALAVKDSNGRSLFLTATEAPTFGGIGSILGYPVTLAHVAPSTNSAGAKVAAFGDPSAHVFALRTDFGFDASDDFAFDGVKRMFRGLARAGVKTRAATGLAVLTLAAE